MHRREEITYLNEDKREKKGEENEEREETEAAASKIVCYTLKQDHVSLQSVQFPVNQEAGDNSSSRYPRSTDASVNI